MIRALRPVRATVPPRAQVLAAALHACDWLAATACWMALNLLAALGVMVAVFAMIGHLSFGGFFLELGHLADHYRSAGLARQQAFHTAVYLALGLFTAGFAGLRVAALRVLAERLSGKMCGKMLGAKTGTTAEYRP